MNNAVNWENYATSQTYRLRGGLNGKPVAALFLSIQWQSNWSNSNDIVWWNSTNRNEGFRNRTYLVDCLFVKSTSFGRIVRDSNNWTTMCAFQRRLLFIPRTRFGKSLLSRITFIRFADPVCDCGATRFTRGYASVRSSSIFNRNVKRYFLAQIAAPPILPFEWRN